MLPPSWSYANTLRSYDPHGYELAVAYASSNAILISHSSHNQNQIYRKSHTHSLCVCRQQYHNTVHSPTPICENVSVSPRFLQSKTETYIMSDVSARIKGSPNTFLAASAQLLPSALSVGYIDIYQMRQKPQNPPRQSNTKMPSVSPAPLTSA